MQEGSTNNRKVRLWGQLLGPFVLVLVVFYVGAALGVRAPGVDFEAFGRILGSSRSIVAWFWNGSLTSIFCLGVTPILAAFILVELAAMIVPRWRHLRFDPFAGRMTLRRASFVVTGFVAMLQGWAIALYLESLSQSYGGVGLVKHPGVGFRLSIACFVAIGPLLLFLLALQLEKFSIADKFSVLLVSTFSFQILLGSATSILHNTVAQKPVRGLVELLLYAGFFLALRWWFRGVDKPPEDARDVARLFPLPAGLFPYSVAIPLLALPAALANLFPSLHKQVQAIAPGTPTYILLALLFLAVSTLVSAGWFAPERRVLPLWRSAGLTHATSETFRRSLFKASLANLAFLVAFVLLMKLSMRWGAMGAWSELSSLRVGLLVMLLVALDAHGAWKARCEGLVRLTSFRHLYAVPPCLALLERAGIPYATNGLRHRMLWQIFGPFLGATVLVPPERREEALAVIAPLLTCYKNPEAFEADEDEVDEGANGSEGAEAEASKSSEATERVQEGG